MLSMYVLLRNALVLGRTGKDRKGHEGTKDLLLIRLLLLRLLLGWMNQLLLYRCLGKLVSDLLLLPRVRLGRIGPHIQ